MKKIITLLALFSVAVFAQRTGTLTDSRDGKKYKAVQIGSQVWMAENLNMKIGKSLCYENKEENCKKCGRIYMGGDAYKACPKGWHLPKCAEWETLMNALGGASAAAETLKSKDGFSSFACGTGYYFENTISYHSDTAAYFWAKFNEEDPDDECGYAKIGDSLTIRYGLASSEIPILNIRCVKD